MNNLINISILRYSARELQVQKCSLHVNNACKNYKQLRPVFVSNNGFSPQRIKYFLSSNSFSSGNSQNQVNNFSKNNKLHSLYGQPELRSGILKSGLFKNSLWLPGKLNVRYESTSSELAVTDTLSEITNEAEKSGLSINKDGIEIMLRDMSESPLVKCCQEGLEYVHNFSGLPWWATIILTTIVLKSTLFLPFALQQRRALIGLENAQRTFIESIEIIKAEVRLSIKKFGWPEEFAKARYREMLKETWKNALREENTNPIKAVTCVLVQFTAWISMTMALGNLCCAFPHSDPVKERAYSELTTEGIGWFTNLTIPESTLIMPLSVGIMSLSIVALYYKNFRSPTVMQQLTTSIFAFLCLGAIPLAIKLPSGMVLYWLTSTAYGLAFNFILMTPAGKEVLKIPKLKDEIQLKQEFKDKLPELQKQLYANAKAKKFKAKANEI